MTIYLNSLISHFKYLQRTGRKYQFKWAWWLSNRVCVDGARSIEKEILINEGAIRLKEMAKRKGHWMEVDAYINKKYKRN